MRKKITLLILTTLLAFAVLGCQTITTTSFLSTSTTTASTASVPATFQLSNANLTLAVGSAAKLTFTTNATITAAEPAVYQIDDPTIASINQEGDIRALASGSAIITLNYQGQIVATCHIVVAHDIEIVAPRKAVYALGESLNLRDAQILLLGSGGSTTRSHRHHRRYDCFRRLARFGRTLDRRFVPRCRLSIRCTRSNPQTSSFALRRFHHARQ
ncbi:MAG: Ig-like domain-containing protein [Bacillus subtilis]|nr:Ig-like domain-containing protein [Bacillus subtilis]